MGRPGRDLRAILGVAALMLAAVGCGAGVAAVALLPLFTFQFVDEKDPTHEFSFDPQQPTEISGDLTGTETFKGAFSDLAGTYSGRNLDFTVDRKSGGNVRFTGSFVDDDRIQLTSIEGTIIVCRTDTSQDNFQPCNVKASSLTMRRQPTRSAGAGPSPRSQTRQGASHGRP